MSLTPGMEAALDAPQIRLFVAVKIELPDGLTLRLLDGAGKLTVAGEAYVGRDATYGALASLDAIEDGVAMEAPRCRIGLAVPTAAAAATLIVKTVQESAVTVYEGAYDAATGLVIPDPLNSFSGKIDVPNLTFPGGSRVVQYDCASWFEQFFDDDEGRRLSDAFHQSCYPGELGFAYRSAITRRLPWGASSVKPAVTAL